MTYAEAAEYLETFANYELVRDAGALRAMKLDRMRRLCRRLGDPHRGFRSVLVTGTNGKGSICAMLYAMLRESELRVGLYSSPHLEDLRERIRVWNGSPAESTVRADDWISEADFAGAVEELQPALEALRTDPAGPPTYFEAVTAAAFLQFRRCGVNLAVLEVGMGGRLDATNVVDQAVSVIGPIGDDHGQVLGLDPAAIAREKAGIIKPRQMVITAAQRPEVLEVLQSACLEQGAPLIAGGRDLTASVQQHSLDGLECTLTGLRGMYAGMSIPLLGRHQAQNAALAVGALEALADTGVPHRLVQRGLARVEWPGRIEPVHDAPLILMDGAHNADAADALASALTELCAGRTLHLLVGMSGDKSPEELGRRLGRMAASATCTSARHPRALDPAQLAGRLWPYCNNVHVMPDPVDALTYLLNAVPPQDVIVVTGSLFLVGQLRAAMRRAGLRPRRRTPPQLVG
jgi:dihydrofolate synthase/folylpolyglutamate synthase